MRVIEPTKNDKLCRKMSVSVPHMRLQTWYYLPRLNFDLFLHHKTKGGKHGSKLFTRNHEQKENNLSQIRIYDRSKPEYASQDRKL